MHIRQYFGSKTQRTYQTRPYTPRNRREDSVFHRQMLIPGFDQSALERAVVVFIGCGGLGSWPALGLIQAGGRYLLLCDRDVVEASNGNRQLFTPRQVGMRKVFALGETLSRFGAGKATITANPFHFEDLVALYGQDVFATSQVAVIGVDSEESRVAASQHFRRLGIAAIFSGVSSDGKTGSIFIQSPGGPCYGCCFPQVVKALRAQSLTTSCAPTPAMSPILHAISGLVLEAIFSVLMPGLFHDWSYFYLCVDASLPSGGSKPPKRQDCPLCGEGAETEPPDHTRWTHAS
jgi:molybdopterin/thiamine biosynthesis adenylyltransferase